MTMCTSIECQMKEECYRAVAENDDRQECFNYEYTCNELSGFCDFVSAKTQKVHDNWKNTREDLQKFTYAKLEEYGEFNYKEAVFGKE